MGTKCCASRTRDTKKSEGEKTVEKCKAAPSANALFLTNEILKQRNIKMMTTIYGAIEAIKTRTPARKFEEIVNQEQIKLKWRLQFEEDKAMKKYSSFLSEKEYKLIINSNQGASILKERNREIEAIITGALSGKWIFPLKLIPPPAIYIEFYSHVKAINLFLCQEIISNPSQLTKEKAIDSWANMDLHLKKKIEEIIDIFMEPSPDLVYQFYLLGEHYRLTGDEDGDIIQNIQEFYEELLEMVQRNRVVIPNFNLQKKYDNIEVQNYYKKLLEIGGSLDTVKNLAVQELKRIQQFHK